MTKQTTTKSAETTTDRIRRLLEAEEQRMSGEKSPSKRNTISRTVLMFLSELRKSEAEERKRTDALSKPLVFEWIRQMDPTEQKRFITELLQLTTKKSGLA